MKFENSNQTNIHPETIIIVGMAYLQSDSENDGEEIVGVNSARVKIDAITKCN
jgi:hypothetical protein